VGDRVFAKRSPRGWFWGANHIGTYMARWYVQTPWFTIRLHHILRSDNAVSFHDHPWDFTSFLLSGGYTEVTPTGTRWWPRFSVIRRRAEDLHRLVLTRPVWTLVLTGPRRREWGFEIDGQWVHWQDAEVAP
jgi:hypothetical protein